MPGSEPAEETHSLKILKVKEGGGQDSRGGGCNRVVVALLVEVSMVVVDLEAISLTFCIS